MRLPGKITGVACTGLFALIILSACHRKKVEQVQDGLYVITKVDTTIDAKTVRSKANSLINNDRFDDALTLLNANMHRFKGLDRAMLLDQHGTAYFLKDDFSRAIADYQAAYELDTANSAYLFNLTETYQKLQNKANTLFYANKILQLSNASDSDRNAAKEVIRANTRVHSNGTQAN